MKDNRIFKNTSIALIYEVIAIAAGLILPRLVIVNFGSDYNGVVASITQILGFAVLLRSGIGGVSKAHFYKSLKQNDKELTAKVMASTKHFMNKVSLLFLMFLIALACVYPFIVSMPWLSTALLVLICGLSALTENYYGISSMILLQADRREYIISIGNILSTILNVIVVVVIINLNLGIHAVKLGSALAFCLNPIFLFCYTKKHYNIDQNVKYDPSLLKQKKDALVHVSAEFIHRNSATIVLTVFATTLLVSVYSVYAIIVNGLRKLTAAFTTSFESLLGHLYNSKEKEGFENAFNLFEYFVFLLATFVYTVAACLFSSFINVYTRGVNDVEYVIPLLGVLLCFAEFLDLIKTPYQFVIRISGRFKETKMISVLEALINIVVSVSLVFSFGIIGVVIGTLVAMVWRTIAYIVYVKRNALIPKNKTVLQMCFVSAVSVALSIIFHQISMPSYANSYGEWVLQAVMTTVSVVVIMLVINFVFMRKRIASLFRTLKCFTKR